MNALCHVNGKPQGQSVAFSYRSFKELARHEAEGTDYCIRVEHKDSLVLVMAPHGGNIEPGTSEIARAIAGKDHSFYSFEGLKSARKSILHIESHLFDEPRALQAAGSAGIVVTVHGQIDQTEAFVMLGGLHDRLREEIQHTLEGSGFSTRPPTEGLGGTDPMNICNRGKSKSGVQLEVSRKIRDAARMDHSQLISFASAVRRAIQVYLSSVPKKA